MLTFFVPGGPADCSSAADMLSACTEDAKAIPAGINMALRGLCNHLTTYILYSAVYEEGVRTSLVKPERVSAMLKVPGVRPHHRTGP